MKQRHIYSAPDLSVAKEAVVLARSASIEDGDISLVARADIELDRIPDERKLSETDFVPAALRGAGIGGAAGVMAGLVAVVATPLGLTLAGAAVAGLAGAAVGSWASALVGSSVQDLVRRKFETEVEAGRVLLVIDGEDDVLSRVESEFAAIGAIRLDYQTPSAIA